ncbi:Arm DNA-binding domain-containing protein [Microvirga terrae]|uniref:Arm DNA-binding domain-containing protein n=1 Tax=Microvirga terrae TaxID=2740529 RepID=UPI0015710289
MARPLTAQSLDELKTNPAKRLEVPDWLLRGLYLTIQPSGARSWAVRYRCNGQTRMLTLGPYPAFTLATARECARAALKAAQAGGDPAPDKRQGARATAAAADAREPTFPARFIRLTNQPRTVPTIQDRGRGAAPVHRNSRK